MALRAVRGTWDRFVRLTTLPGARSFRCGCSRGGGKLHVPPIDLVRPDVLRPAGWWAEHCPQPCPFRAAFWLGCSHAENPTPAGAPSFHAAQRRYRPALQDLLGITHARGRRARMGELSHKKSIPFGYTEKHALCSIRLHYADVYYWMSFT